jgi:hypothetical protein
MEATTATTEMQVSTEATTTDAMTTDMSVPTTQTTGQSVSCNVDNYYHDIVVFQLNS